MALNRYQQAGELVEKMRESSGLQIWCNLNSNGIVFTISSGPYDVSFTVPHEIIEDCKVDPFTIPMSEAITKMLKKRYHIRD